MFTPWRAAAIAVLSLPFVHAPSASAVPMPAPLSLIVLNPDGTPATDAVAVARIAEVTTDGTHTVPIYRSTPDASGVVEVAIPASDPYIRARYPEQRVFAVNISLYTFHDAVTRRVKAYHAVNYVLNLGDPAYSVDPARVDNTVVELVEVPSSLVQSQDDALPDFDNCPEPPPSGQSACVRVTHPPDVQAMPVVLAHNVGAHIDMSTTFTVAATAKAGTTTVSGVDGLFVEAKGHDSLSTSVSDLWGFESDGISSPNEDAAVLTNFAKVETRECNATSCVYTTDFQPDAVVGTAPLLPTDEVIHHGYAKDPSVVNTDCTIRVENYWTHTNGVQKAESWTFGFDFQGQYKVFTLHATAVTTNFTVQTLTTSYKWRVVGSSRPYHHVFVPAGHVSTGADAGSVCPHVSPSSTWTDSSWINKENPRRPVTEVHPPDPAPQPVKDGASEGQRQAGEWARRCEAAPERCGSGY